MYLLTETIIKGISCLRFWRCWPRVCQPLCRGLAAFQGYLHFVIASTTQRILCPVLHSREFYGSPGTEAVPVLPPHFPHLGPSPHGNVPSRCDSSDSRGAAPPSAGIVRLWEKRFVRHPRSVSYGQSVFFHQLRIQSRRRLLFSLKKQTFYPILCG